VTGLYLYGSVGSGKSLLMDMFYNVVTEHGLVPNKRRMHFNAAMLAVNLPALIRTRHEQSHGHEETTDTDAKKEFKELATIHHTVVLLFPSILHCKTLKSFHMCSLWWSAMASVLFVKAQCRVLP